MSLEAGTWVGRFRITRLIAQGGMAEVYRAEQELAGGIFRPAALKVIRPEYSESQDFREMFLDEARLACTLSHPNIVHIYEVGESDGRLYMAMELVPGESLAFVARQLREKGERFADEALIAIGIFTCSALEMVHGLRLPGEGHVNLVHRDVSPHNLLLGPNGSLKLIDFGIAKALSNRNLTMPGVTKGKAGYFSPEQAMGRALDGRSDLFSLGVTLYKLAWGGTPFDEHKTHHERNTALVHGRWTALREVCPELPEGFYDVVDRALQVNPKDRFGDAQQMRLSLERLALTEGFHVGTSTLAGYLEPQADDPLSHGTRPQPGSARIDRPGGTGSTILPGQAAPTGMTAAARTAASHRQPAVAPPSISAPGRPRHTERIARSQSSPSSVQVEKTRRRLFVVSGAAVALLAVILGLVLGERAARGNGPAPPAVAGRTDAAPRPVVPAATAPAPKAAVERVEVAGAKPPPAPVAPGPAAVTVAVSERPAPKRDPKPAPPPVAVHAPAPVVAPAPIAPSPPRSTTEPAAKGNGRLRIGGSDDAEVLVNGQRKGDTPVDLQVPAGVHSVVVRSKDGKRQLSERVEVRADRTSRVVFDFDRSVIQVGN